jgi:hypothetical protein
MVAFCAARHQQQSLKIESSTIWAMHNLFPTAPHSILFCMSENGEERKEVKSRPNIIQLRPVRQSVEDATRQTPHEPTVIGQMMKPGEKFREPSGTPEAALEEQEEKRNRLAAVRRGLQKEAQSSPLIKQGADDVVRRINEFNSATPFTIASPASGPSVLELEASHVTACIDRIEEAYHRSELGWVFRSNLVGTVFMCIENSAALSYELFPTNDISKTQPAFTVGTLTAQDDIVKLINDAGRAVLSSRQEEPSFPSLKVAALSDFIEDSFGVRIESRAGGAHISATAAQAEALERILATLRGLMASEIAALRGTRVTLHDDTRSFFSIIQRQLRRFSVKTPSQENSIEIDTHASIEDMVYALRMYVSKKGQTR